jgi:hypothetical protein
MTRKLIALVAVLVFGVACGRLSDTGAGGGAPEDPVTSSPVDPGDPIPSPTPRIVEPTPGLTGVHPNAFDKAVAVDGDTVRVEYYLGVEDCYGLDHVDVEYGEEVVIITLYSGNVPGAEVCIDIAEFVATIVDLDEPLNGRQIVDGAAEEASSGYGY